MEPGVLLYRIGRSPDPLSPPPLGAPKNSGNRFDDPQSKFWVMYAAEQRRTCFAETLARFRPDLELLARLVALPGGEFGDEALELGVIPDDWHLKRMIAAFRVVPGQRWLDLRLLTVREHLRHEMARTFVDLGRDDFDLGDALSRNRALTQAIARWAYENGFEGIIYKSRLDAAFDCWALFEGALYEPVSAMSIAHDDEDLIAVATLFGLKRSP